MCHHEPARDLRVAVANQPKEKGHHVLHASPVASVLPPIPRSPLQTVIDRLPRSASAISSTPTGLALGSATAGEQDRRVPSPRDRDRARGRLRVEDERRPSYSGRTALRRPASRGSSRRRDGPLALRGFIRRFVHVRYSSGLRHAHVRRRGRSRRNHAGRHAFPQSDIRTMMSGSTSPTWPAFSWLASA